jgi:hypothetical protein
MNVLIRLSSSADVLVGRGGVGMGARRARERSLRH